MANVWRNGFLLDSVTKRLVVTSSTIGAKVSQGWLRAPTGALVVK